MALHSRWHSSVAGTTGDGDGDGGGGAGDAEGGGGSAGGGGKRTPARNGRGGMDNEHTTRMTTAKPIALARGHTAFLTFASRG